MTPALEIFQGGQSEAARDMAATPDWMFLNGGPPEKIAPIVADVRERARRIGRDIRFALYAIPLCRDNPGSRGGDCAMIENVDPDRVAVAAPGWARAQPSWAESPDPLTALDSNEGFASRLIGSPDTVYQRAIEFHDLGIDMLHLVLTDDLFVREVLPRLQRHA